MFLPAPGAAAIIDGQNCIAVRGEPLTLCAERVCILSIGTAMNSQQQRYLRALYIPDRLHEKAMNLSPVLALEADILRLRPFDFRHHGVVLMREAPQTATVHRINFVVLSVSAGEDYRAGSRR